MRWSALQRRSAGLVGAADHDWLPGPAPAGRPRDRGLSARSCGPGGRAFSAAGAALLVLSLAFAGVADAQELGPIDAWMAEEDAATAPEVEEADTYEPVPPPVGAPPGLPEPRAKGGTPTLEYRDPPSGCAAGSPAGPGAALMGLACLGLLVARRVAA